MRKFLMAAGLLALVACGDKKADPNAASNTMAPTAPPAMSAMDSLKKDSLMKDSIRRADSMSKAMAPAKP